MAVKGSDPEAMPCLSYRVLHRGTCSEQFGDGPRSLGDGESDRMMSCSKFTEGEVLDSIRQMIHAGLEAIEHARSGLRSTVDDLVDEGTITRDQAEAVLEAWQQRSQSSGASSDRKIPPQEDRVGDSHGQGGVSTEDIKHLVQRLVPVARDEYDLLVKRVEDLEKQLPTR